MHSRFTYVENEKKKSYSLQLSSIPLYLNTTSSLSIHHLMDI